MSSENWKIITQPEDYFSQARRKLAVSDRRPVIKRASDIVGPAINFYSRRIDSLTAPIALFNGYYFAETGAFDAPTSSEPYAVHTIQDSEIGGTQVAIGIDTNVEWRRTFRRAPDEPEVIFPSGWKRVTPELMSGVASLAFSGSTTATPLTVNFPDTFSAVPATVATPVGTDPRVVLSVSAVTVDDFVLRGSFPIALTATIGVAWIATV